MIYYNLQVGENGVFISEQERVFITAMELETQEATGMNVRRFNNFNYTVLLIRTIIFLEIRHINSVVPIGSLVKTL